MGYGTVYDEDDLWLDFTYSEEQGEDKAGIPEVNATSSSLGVYFPLMTISKHSIASIGILELI